MPAAVVLGVPFTALGITLGGWPEFYSATIMAVAGLAVAAQLARYSAAVTGAARVLVGIAAASLTAGMGLALAYAFTTRFGNSLEYAFMARTHGSLNALGFGFLGLVGLTVAELRRSDEADVAFANLRLGASSPQFLGELRYSARRVEPEVEPGALERPLPEGFRRDTWRRATTTATFEDGVDALQRWSGHQAAGFPLSPPRPELREGETLALGIVVGPLGVSATCRITRVIDTPDRFGFVYSTLEHHPEIGEESFIVQRRSDGFEIVVDAVWKPGGVASAICPPLTRAIQRRFIGRYLQGITDHRQTPRHPASSQGTPGGHQIPTAPALQEVSS